MLNVSEYYSDDFVKNTKCGIFNVYAHVDCLSDEYGWDFLSDIAYSNG